MKIFVSTSISSQVDYRTGEVSADFKAWLEEILNTLETVGHTVFCALRADRYKINQGDPAAAFRLDEKHIREADILFALLGEIPSSGVQTEIGMAVALGKKVYLVHLPEHALSYFNAAMVKAGVAGELLLPVHAEDIASLSN